MGGIMKEIVKEERIDVLVESGEIVPEDVQLIEVWTKGNKLKFDFDKLTNTDELFVFGWHYYKKKPYYMTPVVFEGHSATFEINRRLFQEMSNDKADSVRLAYVFRQGNKYECGFFKKCEIPEGGVPEEERLVWKMPTEGNKEYTIYWTPEGILSLRISTERAKELERKLSVSKVEKEVITKERDQFLYELTETRNSKTYKLAQKLVSVPRHIGGYKYRAGQIPDYKKDYNYILSVVVAVYNTKYFLAEMLDSVIAQKQDVLAKMLKSNQEVIYKDYLFSNIYELILVDDGSTDGSGEICDRYAKKYPWIKVIHKENGGVSKARNAGVEIASGKYITFPDSDDKLDVDVFEKCVTFFEEHQDEVAFVTYPHRFFDGQTGDHWTAYRFKNGTRVADVLEEYDQPQYFTNACFFLTEDIQNKIKFDSNLINGEDTIFANDILFGDKHKIGLMADCSYGYRRRTIGELSAIQMSKKTEKYYLPYVTDVLGYLMNTAQEKYGYIPRYIQYTVMGQIQWRLRSDGDGSEAISVVGEEGFENYRNGIKELIKKIDVDIIASQKNMYREHIFYAANLRCDGKVERVFDFEKMDVKYYFDGVNCTNAAGCYVQFEFMKIHNGILKIEGRIANLESNISTWAELTVGDEKKEYPFVIDNNDVHSVRILNDIALHVNEFKVEIPISDILTEGKIEFYSNVAGYKIQRTMLRLAKFMPISKEFSASYYMNEDWVVRKEGNTFIVNNNATEFVDYEIEYQNQILKSSVGKRPEIKYALDIRRSVINRKNWYLQQNKHKKIWLVSDRYLHADDNGEAFFTYLSKIEDDSIDVYFVIDADAADYQRLSEIGNVVAQDSKEHHILHMMADCIISSQADEYIWDPFWRKNKARELFKDFYANQKFVFLQHGVIKDDLSGWLNRYNKNIDGFIVSAYGEAKSILDYNYYYQPENVWLTGLPRFDRLYHNEQKHILIMPTWRKWLMKDFDAAASDKDAVHVRDDIENTEFFNFYHGLINNKRLLDACDEYGYKLCFMPHTNFRECLHKFVDDERIIAYDFDKKYRDAFAEGNLLVSDYSSTPMDFVYLGKPVVYAQFDYDQFFGGSHTYSKGYFDYEKDGFGEVVSELDSLVDLIIEYIKSDCTMKPKYKKRLENFFGHIDQNNCQRVYEKIKALDAGNVIADSFEPEAVKQNVIVPAVEPEKVKTKARRKRRR